MIKVALIDLDRTLVTEDMLRVISELASKRGESEGINASYLAAELSGTESIIKRVALLKGLNVLDIEKQLRKKSYLRKGSEELMQYLKSKRIITVLVSRNIAPVVEFYRRLLGIDFGLGTEVIVSHELIEGVSHDPIPKSEAAKAFLDQRGISRKEAVALGDSIGDRKLFSLVGTSIAVNPSGAIADYSTHVIYDDLAESIPIIEAVNVTE